MTESRTFERFTRPCGTYAPCQVGRGDRGAASGVADHTRLFLLDMRTLIVVLLVSKIGFITNEIVTGLKLLELGFSREDLALAVLCDFPLEIVFGYYAARWSSGDKPLVPWLTAFYGRLACSVLGMLVIYIFPVGGAVGRVGFYFGAAFRFDANQRALFSGLFYARNHIYGSDFLYEHDPVCQHRMFLRKNKRSIGWGNLYDSGACPLSHIGIGHP